MRSAAVSRDAEQAGAAALVAHRQGPIGTMPAWTRLSTWSAIATDAAVALLATLVNYTGETEMFTDKLTDNFITKYYGLYCII